MTSSGDATLSAWCREHLGSGAARTFFEASFILIFALPVSKSMAPGMSICVALFMLTPLSEMTGRGGGAGGGAGGGGGASAVLAGGGGAGGGGGGGGGGVVATVA